jgi:hypothetical protein
MTKTRRPRHTYVVSNAKSGVVLGKFRSTRPIGAIWNMTKDAGYSTWEDAAEACGMIVGGPDGYISSFTVTKVTHD